MPQPMTHIGDGPAPRKKSGVWGCALFAGGLIVVVTLIASLLLAGWQSKSRDAAIRKLSAIKAAGYPSSSSQVNDFYDELVADGPDVTSLWLDAIELVRDPAVVADLQAFGFRPFGALETPPVDADWPEAEQARALLARQEKVLRAFHTVARRPGNCRYPSDFRQKFNISLDHLNDLRQAARLLSLEATMHAHDQNSAAYVDSVETIFAVGDSAQYEPVVISAIVRIAVHSIAIENVRKTLTRLELPVSESRQLRKLLDEMDYQRHLQIAYLGERGFTADVFLDPTDLGSTFGNSKLGMLPTKYSELNTYLDWMEQVIDASNQPLADGWLAIRAISQNFEASLHNMSPLEKAQNILISLIFPAVQPPHRAVGRATFLARACSTSLAIEEYRQTHQAVPSSLNDLVPDFVDSVALDPYSQRPLKFKPTEEGYLVYSVGYDLIDNGGEMTGEQYEPDMIFRVPSEPPEEESEQD